MALCLLIDPVSLFYRRCRATLDKERIRTQGISNILESSTSIQHDTTELSTETEALMIRFAIFNSYLHVRAYACGDTIKVLYLFPPRHPVSCDSTSHGAGLAG